MSYSTCTPEQIEEEVYAIVSVLPPPRGMDGTTLLAGYVRSLSTFPVAAIHAAVDGFMNGRFAADFSMKWCPTPPELAVMVRKVLETKVDRPADGVGRRKYAYNAPNSQCAERYIRRDDARRLVDQGMYPKGCIWVPGSGEKQEFGDLYYSDPEWRTPVLIRTAEEVEADEAVKPKEIGMTAFEKRAAADHLGEVFRQTPPRERGGFWARDHSETIHRFVEAMRASEKASAMSEQAA